MENVFESLIKATPIIKQIIEEDCAIVIKDNEKFHFVEEGKNINIVQQLIIQEEKEY